jgi:hypothetical protein
MKKMTPREALYHICLRLGPVETNRNDNIQYDEAVLRDSVRTLQNFITYHDDADKILPDSVDEFVHVDPKTWPKDEFVHVKPTNQPNPMIQPRKSDRGSGKERLDTWKEEVKSKTFTGKTKY